MSHNSITQQVYNYLKDKRGCAYLLTLAFLLLCLGAFFTATIRADIKTMLPEGEDGALSRDFAMLSESSLANNVFITVHGKGNASRQELIDSAKQLSKQLSPPHFNMIDPTSVNPLKVMNFLLDNAPNLLNENDLARVAERTQPDAVKKQLDADFRQLTSPKGMVMKSLIRRDPLGFRALLAPRLKTLNALSEATIENGHVFSKDGTAILLTAKSDIPLTDADGAGQLLAIFNKAADTLPPNIEAEIISGHIHTVANASTIKSDLLTISLVALVALGLLFVLFFRSSQALGVFLVPAVAMCCAMGGLALFSDTISAIVIGFGAVLIGISIDFAMHVYFAIARHNGNPGDATRAVSRPILFCGLTSCAAFGALFLSGIPGIRQLALFSICGLTASVLFSLVILPHLCRYAKVVHSQKSDNKSGPRRPRLTLGIWAVVMIVCIWFGSAVSIDPDLRNIGYIPESVQKTEQRFAYIWGNMRSRAVIFAQGDNLEATLANNERVNDALTANFPDIAIASLAPLIPSFKTQSDNSERWNAFWSPETHTSVIDAINTNAKSLGFSSKAFLPFENALNSTPAPITPDALNSASLGLIKDMFLPETTSGETTMLTFLPDSAEVRAFFSPDKEEELGVHLISNARFKAALETAMNSDIKHFIIVSGLAVIFLAFMFFRDIRRACLALLPAATGIVVIFGVLGATHTDLNLFHITALPLVIGLGADYGIFLVSRETQIFELSTMAAVKVSGLTTLAGFGVLILARHPSLHSLGITVLVGIGAALISALYIMPHLLRRTS
ncbi:MAG: MMPL family transporter [Pseudodesulfovibrio sp.]